MSRKPRGESTRPRHVTLAVVLQVRGASSRCFSGNGRAIPTAARGAFRAVISRRVRPSRTRSAGTSPRRSTSARCRISSNWRRTGARPGPPPGSSRRPTSASSSSASTRTSRRTRAGTWSTTCPRWRSTTARSCSPAASGSVGAVVLERGFALAPPTFTLAELREIYTAALGHEVSATNLKRVLERRAVIEPTGDRRLGPRRWTAGRGLSLPRHAARDHRPLRRAAPSALKASRPTMPQPAT